MGKTCGHQAHVPRHGRRDSTALHHVPWVRLAGPEGIHLRGELGAQGRCASYVHLLFSKWPRIQLFGRQHLHNSTLRKHRQLVAAFAVPYKTAHRDRTRTACRHPLDQRAGVVASLRCGMNDQHFAAGENCNVANAVAVQVGNFQLRGGLRNRIGDRRLGKTTC